MIGRLPSNQPKAQSWSQQQGCAQGSCTGPMFWNLVANEIIYEEWQPNVHLQAFADDFIFVISEPMGAKLKDTAQVASRNSNTGLTNTNSRYLQKNPPPSSSAD
ncbi:hypothetical protein AVEN_260949-1 [Araneus ventricosus]|uniref:Reverse transcriptase domain-containing protein n=1 Tax=Araneus ventricosus TaxID=182803 RepID=A0A4Y2KG75_ARAVE|nr:hypothetical protein AVEN_260949-1 [Araneus ventricosus]